MGPVLIVDDDQELREVLREILEEEGYQVTEAANGTIALDLLGNTQERWVVLRDYLMPHGDGKRLLQAVSRDEALSTRHSSIRVIARARLSLPVLELATTLSIPVVCKPFELEVSAFNRSPGVQLGRGGSAGLKGTLTRERTRWTAASRRAGFPSAGCWFTLPARDGAAWNGGSARPSSAGGALAEAIWSERTYATVAADRAMEPVTKAR